jgi:DNA-binding NarL/FixJ family response regulator
VSNLTNQPARSNDEGKRIRVCLVDDQTLVRAGIRSLLELSDSVEVIAEAIDADSAIKLIPEIKPDVVLLDMQMPGKLGLEVLRELGAKSALPPTVILTTFDDDQYVLAGIQAGARGYLLKDVSLDQLVDAIKTVATGGTLVKPAVTERLLAGMSNLENKFAALDSPDHLTERETEILRLMSAGYSNKEIARALDVAEGTVKNHVSNILSKLGVRDRTRAVLKAFELKLV